MRNLTLYFLGFLFLTSCTQSLYVTSDFDKSADLSEYMSFAWAPDQEEPTKDNPFFDNEITRKRIKKAITEELEIMGLQKVDSIPDLFIDFHLIVDERVNYIAHDYYPFYLRYWPNYDITSYTVTTSTIVIHFVDFKNEQLVWQGTGSWTLVDPPTSEEEIKKAVKEILDQYQKAKKTR
jgi:hypothetical protein